MKRKEQTHLIFGDPKELGERRLMATSAKGHEQIMIVASTCVVLMHARRYMALANTLHTRAKT